MFYNSLHIPTVRYIPDCSTVVNLHNNDRIRRLDVIYDQEQVERLAAEQGELTKKLILEKQRAKSQVFAILTEEQKAKASQMVSEFMKRRMDHRRFKASRADEF